MEMDQELHSRRGGHALNNAANPHAEKLERLANAIEDRDVRVCCKAPDDFVNEQIITIRQRWLPRLREWGDQPPDGNSVEHHLDLWLHSIGRGLLELADYDDASLDMVSAMREFLGIPRRHQTT